jgi:polyhydroxybutyrate depolymerase
MDANTNQGPGGLGQFALFITGLGRPRVRKCSFRIGDWAVTSLILLCLCVIQPTDSLGANPSRKIKHILFYEGQPREFTVYLPPGHQSADSQSTPPALPVVFAFHGVLMNGETMAEMTHLHNLGNRCNFIVVYPDGDGHGIFRTWNSGGRSGRLERIAKDDVGFVRCMVGELKKRYRVDDQRIHATGFSNGAMLCYRLAVEAPDIFASIAPVAGTLAVSTQRASRYVPTLHIHGTDDKVVAWNGPNLKTPKNLDFLSVPETIHAWKKLLVTCNASDSDALVCQIQSWPDRKPDKTRVEVTRYLLDPDSETPDFQFVRVIGGGHTWPGGENREWVVGDTSEEFSANEMMWGFFQKHPLR